jgi:hypothetical protein
LTPSRFSLKGFCPELLQTNDLLPPGGVSFFVALLGGTLAAFRLLGHCYDLVLPFGKGRFSGVFLLVRFLLRGGYHHGQADSETEEPGDCPEDVVADHRADEQ